MFKFLAIGIAITLVFFVGAIRRWFFAGAWRFIVPLIVGFTIGVPLAAKTVYAGAPPELIIIAPIFASLLIACGLMGVLEDILGPPKDRK